MSGGFAQQLLNTGLQLAVGTPTGGQLQAVGSQLANALQDPNALQNVGMQVATGLQNGTVPPNLGAVGMQVAAGLQSGTMPNFGAVGQAAGSFFPPAGMAPGYPGGMLPGGVQDMAMTMPRPVMPKPPPMMPLVRGPVGPESTSSQMAVETVVGGPGRPSLGDHGQADRVFDMLMIGLSGVMIGLGFAAELCFKRKAADVPKKEGSVTSRRSGGRPIAAGQVAPSRGSQATSM